MAKKRPPIEVHEQTEVPGAESPGYLFNRSVDPKARKYCEFMRKARYYAGGAEELKPLLDAKMEAAGIEYYELKNGDVVTIDVSTKRKLTVQLAKGEDGKMVPPADVEVGEIDVGD